MNLQFPASPLAVPDFKEESAGTACVPDGWPPETSASFVGIAVIEDRRDWVPVQQFVSVPLGKTKSDEPVPVLIAQPKQDDTAGALATIAAADAAGDLREAFRSAFRVLDQQLLAGRWETIEKLLSTLLSKPYSTDLGVGVLRFCSSAREHISNWADLMAAARLRCDKDGTDYKVVLRGLL